ncbi:MAG: hypothetical protein U0V70_03885 [Terriglobia bacterium]
MNTVRIALVGDYTPQVIAHQFIPRAITLASASLDCRCEVSWLDTDKLESDIDSRLSWFHGIWCVPGSPYRSMAGAINAIRFARVHSRPFLGTCGGFQHAVLEYARNALGFSLADHAESNPGTEMAFIAPLACPLVEQEGEIRLAPQSLCRLLYGAETVTETYHCRFGLNPAYQGMLDGQELRIAGTDSQGEVRVIEFPEHSFFVATLYQPERSAIRGVSHPLIRGFLLAAGESVPMK